MRDDLSRPSSLVRGPVTDLPSALAVIEQLEDAVRSNRHISMAVGILMERHHVDAATALRELRRTSNDLNLKLTQVAASVVEDLRSGTASAPPPPTVRLSAP